MQSAGDQALQCGSLGAFGGFFDKTFRQHDYQLGRRNCQQFLKKYFSLPAANLIIAGGLPPQDRAAIIRQFGGPAPSAAFAHWPDWIPLIPLCGSIVNEEPIPKRGEIGEFALQEIVTLIFERLRAVQPLLSQNIGGIRIPLNMLTWIATVFGWEKEKLCQRLLKELN